MIRFTLGLSVICLTLILGGYMWLGNRDMIQARQDGVYRLMQERDEAQDLKRKITNVRKLSLVRGDDQKLTLERMLDIGTPGMELRFIGQAQGSVEQGLLRHTFRISGPATFEEAERVIQRMASLPGFMMYKFCYACARAPKGTPTSRKMVDIEGYLYVYDPNTFY